MKEKTIIELGDELYAALSTRSVIEPITKRFAEISVNDAYRVSQQMLARRISAGETLVGYKIGLTNEAVQNYLGVDQPDIGHLTDDMQYACGAEIPISERLIQAKVEGEIAFVLKNRLEGPGVTPADVIDATDYVTASFEIVDSRIRDWKIKIQDTVADNGSAALFVLGDDRADPRDLDLSTCEMQMKVGDEIASSGTGAAAMGSPLNCVAWLANTMAMSGQALQPGDIILSGSLGPVVAAVPGTEMTMSVTGVGSASVRFKQDDRQYENR